MADSSSRRKRSKKSHVSDSSSSSPSSSHVSSSDSDSESSKERHKRHRKHRKHHHKRSESSSRKYKQRRVEKSNEKRERMDDGSNRKHKTKLENSEPYQTDPKVIVQELLETYPTMGNDLLQLLQIIDGGQAVDIRGLSERSLIKHLKELFVSLNLKENASGAFILPSNKSPTLDVVGQIISSHICHKENKFPVSTKDLNAELPKESMEVIDQSSLQMPCAKDDTSAPRRRQIGPEMPSAALLAAAAKLTEAEAELRDSQLEEDNESFIGPPPPALVSEAESTNEAERFEEVTRIMGLPSGTPYDVLSVNRNMSVENVKKRYWKLSLMIHPDKCSHPQAHQAFIILNKAYKEYQDPDKRKALDEKIQLKEQEEAFKAELKGMREAAQWRRLQGISMEGDEELLANYNTIVPKRDEWMTTLPPERKPGGMPTHTKNFSKSAKEGRGDTSSWTDTPSDRVQKAKMNYLEAYNEAAALVSKDEEKKMRSSDADLVDRYNEVKRSKSLVQKQHEVAVSGSKRKEKKKMEKGEWVGQHPWKPWDREKDLTAGRQNVKLDSENMSEGLTSRFSSGVIQRNFL